jgi:hypothetical protein
VISLPFIQLYGTCDPSHVTVVTEAKEIFCNERESTTAAMVVDAQPHAASPGGWQGIPVYFL